MVRDLVKSLLSNGAKAETAVALARTVVPPGTRIPPAGGRAAQMARRAVDEHAAPVGAKLLDVACGLVDQGAILGEGKRFAALDRPTRERLLRRWVEKRATRWPVMLLTGLLKTAHFDQPDIFEEFGVAYDRSAPAESARWMRRVHTPEDVVDGQTIDCDVVVVGTGAGGAVVGAKLAEEGFAVAFVEEGKYHRRDDFEGRGLPAHRDFFRHGTVAVGNSLIPVQMGKMVGGSTAINAATCHRTPPRVLKRWCRRLKTDEFSPEKMERHFDEVEAVLGVSRASERAVGTPGELFAKGCEALGWHHDRVRRNASGCTAEGVCEFGCPVGARSSTDRSYVPRALRQGAVVYTGCRATEVSLRDGGSGAKGVVAETAGGDTVEFRAKATVLACGAVPTPALLRRQGIANNSGRVGRGLSIHPATGVAAMFDEQVRAFRTIPQGYYSDQLMDRGVMIAGAQLPLDVGGGLLPLFGREFTKVMDRFDRVVGSTAIVCDSERPGRVWATPTGGSLIGYWMQPRTVHRLRRGVVALAEIYFAAGAEKVFPLMPGVPVLESPDDVDRLRGMEVGADDFICTSWHPAGTCQPGDDPEYSVVDFNHECHDIDRLFIADASTLPGPPAVNTQITVMAFANRAAERIAERV